MIDHTHYVPVIRWKAGEKWALRELSPEIRRGITPLIELIPNNFEDKKLQKARGLVGRMNVLAEEIVDNWGRSPFFVDLNHVEDLLDSSSHPHPLELLGNGMRSFALKGIPVTGINKSVDQQAATGSVAELLGHGVAIRVIREEIDDSLTSALRELLNRLSLKPAEVHLILDQQVIVGDALPVPALLHHVPRLSNWRSVTLLGGSFPPDLSDIEKNTQAELPREEWASWKGWAEGRYESPRIPTFGDYTVQHGISRDAPPGFSFSASIRYASNDYWVIMRGESVHNDDGPGYDGYLGNAMLLVERPEFRGAEFCAGDRYIHEMSAQSKKPGSPQTWIRAGINHHITLTVRQIASLSGS